ncbi:MAG: hypothetical protein K1X74_21010 [Pirellulales bacterium]|nr:hypothetical protein [Pirellulales bacterium]
MNSQTSAGDHPLAALVGREVVVDLASPFVALGTLAAVTEGFLVLGTADLHDLRDTATTRERYVVECREHGIRANRQEVWLALRDVVAIARLEDVITA